MRNALWGHPILKTMWFSVVPLDWMMEGTSHCTSTKPHFLTIYWYISQSSQVWLWTNRRRRIAAWKWGITPLKVWNSLHCWSTVVHPACARSPFNTAFLETSMRNALWGHPILKTVWFSVVPLDWMMEGTSHCTNYLSTSHSLTTYSNDEKKHFCFSLKRSIYYFVTENNCSTFRWIPLRLWTNQFHFLQLINGLPLSFPLRPHCASAAFEIIPAPCLHLSILNGGIVSKGPNGVEVQPPISM